MANELQLRVDEKVHTITASPETPLLYVITDDPALQGPRFGCGLGQCGCCSVLADGVEIPNSNRGTAYNGVFGLDGATWNRPTAILNARFVQFNITFTY